MKAAVIGVGNMGSKYSMLMQRGEIQGMELAALTRIGKNYQEMMQPCIDAGIPVYPSAEELYADVEAGGLKIDAVIIATPHYSHEELTRRAFKNGLHVLCDKPAGVYSAQGRRMNEAADASGLVYSMVFNQRTLPIHRRLKDIVSSGKYGKLKRVNWVVTDWYRPDSYYTSSSWHATWDKDGGGLLLNQCPHNLDLLCWICGTPSKVQGFCHEGRFHDIEVEDDVTAYMEWENGACGTFISSTGDAPGINRLEITLDEAMVVCENGEIRIGELFPEMGMPEAQYRATSQDHFRKIRGTWKVETPPKEAAPYQVVLQNFADACAGKAQLLADGREGYDSLLLANAIYLSSWEHSMVELPRKNSAEERDFEMRFEAQLDKRRQRASK